MRMSENIDSFGRQLEDILNAWFWATSCLKPIFVTEIKNEIFILEYCYIFGNWIGKNKKTCVNMGSYVDIFH